MLEELTRHLKGAVTPNSAPKLVGGTEYDIIAISKLRNYLHDFRERLLREAVLEAGRAQARLPGYRALAVLGGLVEYCIRRNYKSGLTDLLPPKQFLRECLPEKLMDGTVASGTIQLKIYPAEQQPISPDEKPTGESPARQKVRAEILYRSSANSQPLPVLKIERLVRAEADQIEAQFTKGL